MTTYDLLENYIYPNLDITSLLSELAPIDKGSYYTLICPNCGKKEAYILKRGKLLPIIYCNRKNKCAYKSPIWAYIKNTYNFTNKETLRFLASYSGIDLTKFSNLNHSSLKSNYTTEKKLAFIKIRKRPLMIPKRIKIYSLDNNIKNFSKLDEDLKFMAIVTYIYNFSLKTDHNKKVEFYKNRKIRYIPNDIGFLSTENIISLQKKLKENFPLQFLEKFSIFKSGKFKYNFSDFTVIPSFDIFTNLISAIRLRNIHESKIKEIEISYKRIANPLPYGITREKLKKYNTFYFTEGHIDALSLGTENFVAIEGVNSIDPYNLGIFKNKKIFLLFDMDLAGQEGARRIKRYLDKLKIENQIITWNKKFGKDINDILKKGYDTFKIINL